MASSVGEICNIALNHIGTDSTIASINEKSEEARQCKLLYASARDYILRKHPWSFAEKTVALSSLGSPPPDWSYRYQYPSDCVKAREIIKESRTSSDPVPFKVVAGDDLNSRVILCDKDEAYLRYTARVTNAAVFDASFVQELAWYLALQLAMPLTGKKSVRDDAVIGYRLIVGDAEATDMNEKEPDEHREAEWISGRN